MKPGDRAQRWRTNHTQDGTLFLLAAIAVAFGVDGWAKGAMMCWFSWLAFASFRSARRGWRVRYDLPPWGRKDLSHPDPIRRQMAREAWQETKRLAKDPDRPIYAFDRRHQ